MEATERQLENPIGFECLAASAPGAEASSHELQGLGPGVLSPALALPLLLLFSVLRVPVCFAATHDSSVTSFADSWRDTGLAKSFLYHLPTQQEGDSLLVGSLNACHLHLLKTGSSQRRTRDIDSEVRCI